MFGFIVPYADYILAVCHTCLIIAVLPLLWSGRRIQHAPYATSFSFMVILLLAGLCLFSSGLIFGGATDILGATLWGCVAGERAWQRKTVRRRSGNRRKMNS
mgnify:CR=1 FL=1